MRLIQLLQQNHCAITGPDTTIPMQKVPVLNPMRIRAKKRPGRARLACSSAGGAGDGQDRAKEEDLIGFRYCDDPLADISSCIDSGASWTLLDGQAD